MLQWMRNKGGEMKMRGDRGSREPAPSVWRPIAHPCSRLLGDATQLDSQDQNPLGIHEDQSLVFLLVVLSFILCIQVFCLHVYLWSKSVQPLRSPEEGVGAPGTGIRDGWDLHVGDVSHILVLWRSSQQSYLRNCQGTFSKGFLQLCLPFLSLFLPVSVPPASPARPTQVHTNNSLRHAWYWYLFHIYCYISFHISPGWNRLTQTHAYVYTCNLFSFHCLWEKIIYVAIARMFSSIHTWLCLLPLQHAVLVLWCQT